MEITQSQKITKAILTIRPHAEFTMVGDDYENINWLDNQSKPTWAEIEAEIANPTPQPEPTVSQKLASLGLSLDDLKAALGV